MLEVENLHVAYGGLAALTDVSISVGRGEFASVVGPNGAGKTTLFKAVSGVVPSRGTIRFEGRDLAGVKPADRPHLGIAHVPEGRQVFASLSVMENLEMGASTAAGRRLWSETIERIFAMFPRLKERRTQPAGTLSGGEQQMVAIGRGLASAPKLLMLDEPSMGLSPAMAETIFESIFEIRRTGDLAILLVEQRVAEALENCDRGYVLETGRVLIEGTHDTLARDDRVRQAYLGM